MKKIKIILICSLIPIFVFMALIFLKIKNKEEFQQKVVLAHEMRKVLDYLMLDLREAREGTIQDVPADGQWHSRVAFDRAQQGALEYIIKEGHLLRINKDKTLLIADHIAGMRVRRQKQTPNLLEVQIEAHDHVSLVSNLKVRVRE